MTDNLVKRLREKAYRTETYELVNAAADRIEELEEELRQLRADITPMENGFALLFSRQQAALLTAILKRPIANYAYLDIVTEGYGKYNRYEGAMHQTLRTKVAIWKLRKRLGPMGINIGLRRGVGYFIDAENRAKLLEIKEGVQ